jgi:hypothetical protein
MSDDELMNERAPVSRRKRVQKAGESRTASATVLSKDSPFTTNVKQSLFTNSNIRFNPVSTIAENGWNAKTESVVAIDICATRLDLRH